MKKILCLLCVFLGSVFPARADKAVMNNPWGYSYYTPAHLSNLSFQDISSAQAANAVFVYGTTVNFDEVDFKNNTSHGLYLHAVNGPITLNHMYFYNNTGGAASFWQSQQTIRNSVFRHNSHASGFGGALYIPNPHTLTASQLSFLDNSAEKGGALYAGDQLTLQGGGITFSHNTASQGGGIYASRDLTLAATGGDILFSGNEGGAVYMANGTLTLRPAGGNIIFKDDILGPARVNIVVAGNGSGQAQFYQALSNASVSLQSGSAYFNPQARWTALALQADGGSLYLSDGQTAGLNLGEVRLNRDLHLVPEVNLQTDTMDSLDLDRVSGTGAVVVDRFDLLSEDTQQPSAVDFMTGAKPDVRLPHTVNGSIYAYDVSYNPATGQIVFVPRAPGVAGADPSDSASFNPSVLVQPLRSYLALHMLQESMAPLQHRRQSRFLHYDDAAASFYVTPYLTGGRVKFTNHLQTDTSLSGVQAGWTSADWGLAERFAITGGFNVGFVGSKNKYQNRQLDMSGYQAGAELNIYSGNWWLGLTGQAAAVSSEALNEKQTQPALWGAAAVKWHLPLNDNGWILAPYAQAGYGWVRRGEDQRQGNATLTGGVFSFIQLQGGAEIIKSYNDLWHWYIGGSMVRQITRADVFYANDARLPEFETAPFVQVQAGFQTETDCRGG